MKIKKYPKGVPDTTERLKIRRPDVKVKAKPNND